MIQDDQRISPSCEADEAAPRNGAARGPVAFILFGEALRAGPRPDFFRVPADRCDFCLFFLRRDITDCQFIPGHDNNAELQSIYINRYIPSNPISMAVLPKLRRRWKGFPLQLSG